jgi:hypothetical protein
MLSAAITELAQVRSGSELGTQQDHTERDEREARKLLCSLPHPFADARDP